MIALKDLRPQVARLMFDGDRVAALKREQQELRISVHDEVRGLVESDESVAEMYRMERPFSSSDWERIRRRNSKESMAKEQGDAGTPPGSPLRTDKKEL